MKVVVFEKRETAKDRCLLERLKTQYSDIGSIDVIKTRPPFVSAHCFDWQREMRESVYEPLIALLAERGGDEVRSSRLIYDAIASMNFFFLRFLLRDELFQTDCFCGLFVFVLYFADSRIVLYLL